MAQTRINPRVYEPDEAEDLDRSPSATVVAWRRHAEQQSHHATQEEASRVAQQLRRRASTAYRQVEARVTSAYEQTKRNATALVDRSRRRARHVAEERPLHLIVAVAGAAFMLGVLLRVWRSTRDE